MAGSTLITRRRNDAKTIFGNCRGALILSSTLVFSPAVFAESSDSSSSSGGPEQGAAYDGGYNAAVGERYAEAIGILQDVVAIDSSHADAFNMLGYSHRKSGNYYESFRNYGIALKLDPEHRCGHEYIGQAYLEQKNFPKAKMHLQRLDTICTWGCEEFEKLKRPVNSYEKGGAPNASEYKIEESNG